MSRKARAISASGTYHIMFRGIDKQNIFRDDDDFSFLKQIIRDIKKEIKFEIYAYCMMSNHAHMVMHENTPGKISLIMKRMLTRYVMKFNSKYSRKGSLIENRYKSIPVENDEYFMSLIRYIHQNPQRAKIVLAPENYKWSSYNEYINKKSDITDIELVLSMMELSEFIEFHQIFEEDPVLVDGKIKKSDDQIIYQIRQKYKVEPSKIGEMPKTERNELISRLKQDYSIREIERITGVSRGVIYKIQ